MKPHTLLLSLAATLPAAAHARSAKLSDLGKPTIAGVPLASCGPALRGLGVDRSSEAVLELKGGHFESLTFIGDACIAVGGPLNAKGVLESVPAVGLPFARSGDAGWATSSDPQLFWRFHWFRDPELYWVGDLNGLMEAEDLVSASTVASNVGIEVARDKLGRAYAIADAASTGSWDSWDRLVAAPLVATLALRFDALRVRLDNGEAADTVGQELDELLAATPDWMRGEVQPLVDQVQAGLLLRADAARGAGAEGTAAGLLMLRLRLNDRGVAAEHQALRDALAGLVAQYGRVPGSSGVPIVLPPPSGLSAAGGTVEGSARDVVVPFWKDLPSTGGKLQVLGALSHDLRATTDTGERTQRVRTYKVVDNREAVAAHAATIDRIRQEQAAAQAACMSTTTVVTEGSTVRYNEQFTESERLGPGVYQTTTGVREVTETTEGSVGTVNRVNYGCMQSIASETRRQLSGWGPTPADFVRSDELRTVKLKGELQTWRGTVRRSLQLTEPDGTVTSITQQQQVELGPFLKASAAEAAVNEFRTEAQAAAEASAILDAALEQALTAAVRARIDRASASLDPAWRTTERAWLNWLFADGPAMTTSPPARAVPRPFTMDNPRKVWDRNTEGRSLHTVAPINDRYTVASTKEALLVVLDRLQGDLPISLSPADSNTVLPIPGRDAFIAVDKGRPGVIEASGDPSLWRRVGPSCSEAADPLGFGADGRVLVSSSYPTRLTGWWDTETGAVEKLLDLPGPVFPSLEEGKLLLQQPGGVYLYDHSSQARTLLVPSTLGGDLSLRADGRLLASVGSERWEVWDLQTGKRIAAHAYGSSYPITGRNGAFYGYELWITDGDHTTTSAWGDTDLAFARDPSLRPEAIGAPLD